MNQAHAMARPSELTTLERILLLVPLAGGAVFGIFPFLLGGAFGSVLGAPGNDSFIYRLAGAAAFGYAVALALGIRENRWQELRLVVLATLVFNLGSLLACFNAISSGNAFPVVYAILGTSILISAITLWLLSRYGVNAPTTPNLTPLELGFLVVGTLASGMFGILPLFLPVQTAQFFGFKGTDVFLIQQAGAATLGYVAMAIMALSSRSFDGFRLPAVMALVFNGLSFIAAVIALFTGEPLLITLLIGAATLVMTPAAYLSLRNHNAQ